jgi:hypothetical protein
MTSLWISVSNGTHAGTGSYRSILDGEIDQERAVHIESRVIEIGISLMWSALVM